MRIRSRVNYILEGKHTQRLKNLVKDTETQVLQVFNTWVLSPPSPLNLGTFFVSSQCIEEDTMARIQESVKEKTNHCKWQLLGSARQRAFLHEQFTRFIFTCWVSSVLLWHIPQKLRASSLGWQQGLLDPPDLGMLSMGQMEKWPQGAPGLGSAPFRSARRLPICEHVTHTLTHAWAARRQDGHTAKMLRVANLEATLNFPKSHTHS